MFLCHKRLTIYAAAIKIKRKSNIGIHIPIIVNTANKIHKHHRAETIHQDIWYSRYDLRTTSGISQLTIPVLQTYKKESPWSKYTSCWTVIMILTTQHSLKMLVWYRDVVLISNVSVSRRVLERLSLVTSRDVDVSVWSLECLEA